MLYFQLKDLPMGYSILESSLKCISSVFKKLCLMKMYIFKTLQIFLEKCFIVEINYWIVYKFIKILKNDACIHSFWHFYLWIVGGRSGLINSNEDGLFSCALPMGTCSDYYPFLTCNQICQIQGYYTGKCSIWAVCCCDKKKVDTNVN